MGTREEGDFLSPAILFSRDKSPWALTTRLMWVVKWLSERRTVSTVC